MGENCISSKEPQVLRYFKDSDLEKIKHVFGCVVSFIIRSFLPLKRDTQNSQVSEHKTWKISIYKIYVLLKMWVPFFQVRPFTAWYDQDL